MKLIVQLPSTLPVPGGIVPPLNDTWVLGEIEGVPLQVFETIAVAVTLVGSVSVKAVPVAATVLVLKRLIVIVEVCPGKMLIGLKFLLTAMTASAGWAQRAHTISRTRIMGRARRPAAG